VIVDKDDIGDINISTRDDHYLQRKCSSIYKGEEEERERKHLLQMDHGRKTLFTSPEQTSSPSENENKKD